MILLAWRRLHCNKDPIYVFPDKELLGLSPNFHIQCLWTIYIFPGLVHIIGRSLLTNDDLVSMAAAAAPCAVHRRETIAYSARAHPAHTPVPPRASVLPETASVRLGKVSEYWEGNPI